MNELKPCPFCGEKGIVRSEIDNGYGSDHISWIAECSFCPAEATRCAATREGAVTAWNRRTHT